MSSKSEGYYLGQPRTIARLVREEKAYQDQYGFWHPAIFVLDLTHIQIHSDELNWAFPNYQNSGKPYEPYGKVHYLEAHNFLKVKFTCVQNWDSGRTDMWRSVESGFVFSDITTGRFIKPKNIPMLLVSKEPFLLPEEKTFDSISWKPEQERVL